MQHNTGQEVEQKMKAILSVLILIIMVLMLGCVIIEAYLRERDKKNENHPG